MVANTWLKFSPFIFIDKFSFLFFCIFQKVCNEQIAIAFLVK